MKDSVIKLDRSSSCPGRAVVEDLIEEYLAQGHLTYGMRVVDATADDSERLVKRGFINDARTLVAAIDVEQGHACVGMEQILGLAQAALEARATSLDYDWVENHASTNWQDRTYLLRFTWEP